MFTSTPIDYYVGMAENILPPLFFFAFIVGLWAMMLWEGLRKGDFLAWVWFGFQVVASACVSYSFLF